MHASSRHLVPTVLLLALVMSASGGLVAQEVAPKPLVKPKSQAGARSSDLHSKIWWNHPAKVTELTLSEEQRNKMDALLTAYLVSRSEGPARQQQALKALGEALVAGNQKAARTAGSELAEVTSSGVLDQTQMMVEVVALLTPAQREDLSTRYPRLFSHLWVRTANPQNLRRKR